MTVMWSLDSFWIQKNSHFLKKQVKNWSLTFIDESTATAGILASTWHTYSKDNLSFITFPVSVHQSINDSNCFSKPVYRQFSRSLFSFQSRFFNLWQPAFTIYMFLNQSSVFLSLNVSVHVYCLQLLFDA